MIVLRWIPLALTVCTASAATAQTYEIDPILDGAVLSLSLGIGAVGGLILSTGEILPQNPVSTAQLLGIDRHFATTPAESNGSLLSDLSLGVAVAYLAVDVALSPFLDRQDTALTYAVLYAESILINRAVADLTKLAVRRPRPRAYYAASQGVPITATDDSLSFYSGHTSVTAGIAATAAHFAFTRDPDGWSGWAVTGGGVLLTSFVAWQRVRARSHFPTDVIAGAMMGAGIGVLVPALHRVAPPTIALSPMPLEGGGMGLAIGGLLP